MNQTLEKVIRHLNPAHDLDGIRDIGWKGVVTTKESLEQFKKGLLDLAKMFMYVPKHFIRGGIVGGTFGSLVSLVSGNSPAEGFRHGVAYGIPIDSLQYLARAYYLYIKNTRDRYRNVDNQGADSYTT